MSDIEQILESNRAARIIRKHYGLPTLPTVSEVDDEVANIRRKQRSGTLDDGQLSLYCKLVNGGFWGGLDRER